MKNYTNDTIRRVERLWDGVSDKLSGLLGSDWRAEPSLRTPELERLEEAANASLARYTKGQGTLAEARTALKEWGSAMKFAILHKTGSENRCEVCMHERNIFVVDADGQRVCSRCMQGYKINAAI